MTRFIDLSIPITNDVVSDPEVMRPKVTYMTHESTWEQIAMFFPGLKREDLPDGEGWAVEFVELSTHNGTHMDAPYHYNSVDSKGNPMPTIDQMPLDWYFRPGVKLDFRHFEDGYVATAADVQAELKRIGYELQPMDIVLVNTRAGEMYGTDQYIHSGCGVGREATHWLTEQGVRVTGIDGWSWDAPFSKTLERWLATKDPRIIWEGHYAGIDTPYSHMEKLRHLEQLPSHGFVVSCLPIKIKGASGGWTRAVAMFD
jgi:kynurenine formamidase